MVPAIEERWVLAEGSRLRVLLAGRGPDLLLLNGIGAHADMWIPLVSRLASTRRLIMIDMPGAGGSPPLRRPVRMAALAGIVVGVLDELGVHRVDVLGYSWGGALAQQLAHDSAGRVRRLCLVSTTLGWGGVPPSLLGALAMMNPSRIPALRRGSPPATGRREGKGSAFRRWNDAPPGFRGYAQQLYAIAGWSSAPWLCAVRSRTLVIVGDEDPLVPVANARLMRALLRDAQVYVAPGGGHFWLLDHALESAALIEDFLASGRLAEQTNRYAPR